SGQVEVDHRLAELGQPGPRGLHAVAVRDIEKVDLGHPADLRWLASSMLISSLLEIVNVDYRQLCSLRDHGIRPAGGATAARKASDGTSDGVDRRGRGRRAAGPQTGQPGRLCP